MRLGIISDTHGQLNNGVFDVFGQVDHILHAGDVGDPNILVELQTLAPVTAVYGNTDGFDIRDQCPQVAKIELEGLYVTVTHGDQSGLTDPHRLHDAFPEADVIVFGHTHEPILVLVDKTVTVMNPGSASLPRNGRPLSVGIMEFEVGLPPRARLVGLEGVGNGE